MLENKQKKVVRPGHEIRIQRKRLKERRVGKVLVKGTTRAVLGRGAGSVT